MSKLPLEADRLNALKRYDILDTPEEADFDDIVKIAAQICGTPISLISLIDKDRQWFKAETGAGVKESPLKDSVCIHVLSNDDEVTVIQDARDDPRFHGNEFIYGQPALRFYAGAPLATPDGIPFGMLCVLDDKPRDLTEQQKTMLMALARQVMTQLELRRIIKQKELSDKRLNLIVDSARDFAIISMDIDGAVTTWNTGAEAIFGYTPDEIVGKPVSIIFTPEDCKLSMHDLELVTAVDLGRAADERWHMRKDGTRFFASGIMQAMFDESGQHIGFMKIARDITVQKEAEEAMLAAKNFAEAASIAKSEFLANMSHEIRTPMNAVIGLSNILARSAPLTEKQSEFIKTLQLSANSLLSLINDLLDISKIEAKTVELEHIPFSLTQMTQEVISMMAMKAKEKSLAFTLDGESVKHQSFIGDPTRLRQIILNLCSNAIKFTHQGSVHVKIECLPMDNPATKWISIAVKDTGIGIAADKIETIFEKFMQADSSINREYGGTGLGLAITKTLATIMGGTVSVESQLGEGTCFTVGLPLTVATENSAEVIASAVLPVDQMLSPTEKYTVLLVEDYAPNVFVAGTYLEQFGYNYEVASNGLEAIERVKSKSYVAALMDVQMHGMNGLDATQKIREHEKKTGALPLTIIGMTAHAFASDRERCLAAGMNDYIAKPFNPDELQQKLTAIVQNQKIAA